jgi:hypothetical protein
VQRIEARHTERPPLPPLQSGPRPFTVGWDIFL